MTIIVQVTKSERRESQFHITELLYARYMYFGAGYESNQY